MATSASRSAVGQERTQPYAIILLFWGTSFLSAFLLFMVQPMIGKWLLPLLGGAPSVWNACMVFFQATLLLGYLYAHVLSRWTSERAQLLIHGLLLLAPALALPFAVPLATVGPPPSTASPLGWLALTLIVMAGLPFFVVSTTSPLLQTWYERIGIENPYVLYSSSNLGSLLALLSYPLLFEPLLPLEGQSRAWTAIYAVVALALWACAGVVWRLGGGHATSEASQPRAPVFG